jgi:hypothetical protein
VKNINPKKINPGIPSKILEELAVYLMHIITTIRWHMVRLEFYFKKL